MIPTKKVVMCRTCGQVISLENYLSSKYKLCPNCECDDLELAYTCELCGKYMPTDEEFEGFCKDCAERTIAKHRSLLFEHFNNKEISFLTDIKEHSFGGKFG